MEKERPNALEMAEKENEEGKAQKDAEITRVNSKLQIIVVL